MENRRVNTLGHIRGVDSRSCFIRCCCETNLVVHDNMDRTTDLVVFKILHLKRFKHYALPSHCCVAMHDYRHNLSSLNIASTEEVLLSSCSTHDNWVYTFKVGWIS